MNDLQALTLPEWSGCARVIFDPEDLIERGFSRDVVEASASIMESNFDDPFQTVYDRDGNPVNQMRGVCFYDLAIHIARQHKLDCGTAMGLNRTLDTIRESAQKRLEPGVAA